MTGINSILLTGATGYLGGRLTQQLLQASGQILRIGVRTPDTAPIRNLTGSQAEIVPIDLFDIQRLDFACRKMDAVIHLAAANEILSAQRPEEALRITGLGTLNVVEAAARAGCKRFIFISTSHVYGAAAGRISENSIPNPVNHYGITHLVAEHYVTASAARHGMEAFVLRLTNCVGSPHSLNLERWTLLGNSLCRQAVEERRITLRSSGLAFLDLLPMTDAVRAITQAVLGELHPDTSLTGAATLNVGGERAMRVRDFADLVRARAKSVLGINVEFSAPAPTADETAPDSFSYSIERLKAAGFKPTTSIEQEVDELLGAALTRFAPLK